MDKPSIDPQRWHPPPAPPAEGILTPNERLAAAERWPTGGHVGPEDPAIAPDGRVFAGTDDGTIVRWGAEGGTATEVCRLDGLRPHGMEWHPDGWLVVCESRRGGLLRVDPDSGRSEMLVDRVGDLDLQYVNNATVTADGTTIYFSESARVGNVDHYEADVYAHSGTGRLFRHDLGTGETEVVLAGLQYANGVTLLPDESAVLVAETTNHDIRQLYVSGPRAGRTRVFAHNLPGFPDNLATGPTGTIWAAIPSPRNPILDALRPRTPALRRAVWKLPASVRPAPPRMAMVLAYDTQGNLVDQLQDPQGRAIHYVTGVREHDGYLYLGSLKDDAVARIRL